MKKVLFVLISLIFVLSPLGHSSAQAGETLHQGNTNLIMPMAESTELTQERVNAFDCSTVTDVPTVECEALVALYENTNGVGWSDNTGWLESTEVGDWYGVGIYNGHVTGIYLYEN